MSCQRFWQQGARCFIGLVSAVVMLAVCATAVAATAAKPDPGALYLLSNRLLEAKHKVLAVVGGKVAIVDDDPAAAGNKVLWRLTPIKGSPGYYRIINASLGDKKALDSSASAPTIANTGRYSGQYWRLNTTRTPGYTYLSNLYQRNKSLAVLPAPPYAPRLMRSAITGAQQWKLVPYRAPDKPVAARSQSVAVSSTVVNSKLEIYTDTPDSQPDDQPDKKGVDIGGGSIVIQEGGSLDVGDRPSGSTPSVLPPGTGEQGDMTYGSGQSVTKKDLGPVIVAAPTTDYFGPGWARTTGAAQGEKSFTEPGLTPFLLAGALPIVNSIYSDPATVTSTLRLNAERSLDAIIRKVNSLAADASAGKSLSDSELRFVRREFLRVARDPVGNDAIKGLMGVALISAARKPPSKRSKAEQAFVSHFERYMQRRMLFIAERAQYLYRQWIAREQSKRKSRMQTMMNIPQIPPDVISQARQAAELTAKGVAVAATVGTAVAGGIVAYSSVAIIGAVAPFAADAGAGLFVVSGVASSSASAAVSALAGPVGIAAAGIVVIAISVDQVVKAEEYRKKVEGDVRNARKPIDLHKLASSEDGMNKIRYYWALATGVDEPGIFRGAPAAAFQLPSNVSRYNLKRVPSSASGMGLAGSLDGIKGVKVVGQNLGGVKYGPIEAAWRSYAVAYNSCFSVENILAYQATGKFSCPPPRPTWSSLFKRGKLPPNAVLADVGRVPQPLQKLSQALQRTTEHVGICRFVAPGGATVGAYKDGRCEVSDDGRRRTEGSNFTVLRADPDKAKWLKPKTKGVPGWVPLSALGTVEAGMRSDGAKVSVCRVGNVPGWLWKDQCHVVLGSTVTRMPVPMFDVLVKSAK